MESIEEALAIFEESAIIQGQTQETGDYKKGNKYHKLEMQCVVYLYEHGHLADLEKFLNHKNVYVRADAAFMLLPISEKRSKAILKEIVKKEHGIQRLLSEIELKEWENGEVVYPYQEGFHW
jgi:hypothetical protein